MTFMAVFHLFSGWFGAYVGISFLCFAAYIGTFFITFEAPFLVTIMPHVRAVLLAIGCMAAAATYLTGSAYRDGYTYAINQIAAQSKEAEGHVQEAIGNRQACTNGGGVWNTIDGSCGVRQP